jgi:hypothetical protein
MKTIEHSIQCAYFQWVRLNAHRHPAIAMAFAIPNGGHRDIRTAARLKAEGVRAGVWDVFVPWMAHDRGGLWIEFKAGKSKRTDNQNEFWAILENQYCFKTVNDWMAAAEVTCWYLGIKGTF